MFKSYDSGQVIYPIPKIKDRPEGYKTFMLNSTELGIYPTHKCILTF